MFILKHENAKKPVRSTAQSACFDLSAAKAVTIEPGTTALVSTGLYFKPGALHANEFLAVMSRSGLALKSSVAVLNAPGIVDADYPGEIGVILHNFGSEPFVVKPGDRVAQATIMKHRLNRLSDYKSRETRTGGFGSTGVTRND